MKSITCLLAVVGVVAAMTVAPAAAQSPIWTSYGPFGRVSVNALAINPTTPTTLYAGADGGGHLLMMMWSRVRAL